MYDFIALKKMEVIWGSYTVIWWIWRLYLEVEVVYSILEVIWTKGRYRAALAAKKETMIIRLTLFLASHQISPILKCNVHFSIFHTWINDCCKVILTVHNCGLSALFSWHLFHKKCTTALVLFNLWSSIWRKNEFYHRNLRWAKMCPGSA